MGSLDHEIAIVRMQLHNTLEAQNRARDGDTDAPGAALGLEMQKYVDKQATEFTAGPEAVYERVDYNGHIDRLTARIAMLEKTRAELLEAEAKRRENEDPDGDDAPKWEITIVPAKKG
ncbi:hypothetical protein WI36_24205 [Burkholderia ubonensis]|nr:hypothetical protein WI36_24205 [Burkholderia ubonensis]